MSPQERQQLISEWQSDAITYTEMRHNMKRGGIAYQDDDEAKQESLENPAIAVISEEPLSDD